MLLLRLLGGASIESGDGPLAGPAAQRHRLALLALLVGAYPGGFSRDKLIALLWPEREAEPGRNLLNQAVHALRKALGEEAIVSAAEELRLDAGRVRADVIGFGEALEAEDLERAVSLYAGPFLDGFFLPGSVEFERWAEGERERLRREYLGALEGLAEEAAARGDGRAAVEWWRRLAAEEPYSSRVTLRLMEALEAAGDREAAIRQAEAHGELLARELAAEPSPEIVALAERMRTDPRDAPDRGEVGLPESAPHVSPPEASGPPGGSSRWKAVVAVGAALLIAAAVLSARWILPGGNASQPVLAGATEPGRRTIAVLPFEDLTGTPDDAAFTQGIHSDLITALSGIGALRVISRASVLPYHGRTGTLRRIGEELGADVVLQGGVQRLGDRVRLNVQLADPRSGELLWAESYTRELSVENLFAIQSQVTERIAASLEASLTQAELARVASPPTGDLAAYQYYQQAGLAFDGTTRAGNEEAERLLRLALEVDPQFAPAWASLAGAYGWRAPYLGVPTSAWDSTMAFARRALELDPDHADAYTAMALTYGHQGFLARQEEAAREALDRNPSDGLAVRRLAESHRERGEFLDALRLHQESVRLSPNELVYRSWVGHLYADLGEHAKAASWYRGVQALSPDYFHPLWGLAAMHLRLERPDSAALYAARMASLYPDETVPLSAAAMIFHYLGDFEAAKRHAARAVAIAGDAPAREVHSLLATTLLGLAELRNGDTARAETLFKRSLDFLESRVAAGTDTPRWPYEIGLIQAARGDLEGAVAWLEKAYERGFRWAWMLELEPMLDPLRGDPRFREVLLRTRADVQAMRRRLEREESRAAAEGDG